MRELFAVCLLVGLAIVGSHVYKTLSDQFQDFGVKAELDKRTAEADRLNALHMSDPLAFMKQAQSSN